jgi:hypothetical protein
MQHAASNFGLPDGQRQIGQLSLGFIVAEHGQQLAGCDPIAAFDEHLLHEPKTVYGQVREIEPGRLSAPEPVLEFQKQPAGCEVKLPEDVEIKQQLAAGRLAELEEHRISAYLPGP